MRGEVGWGVPGQCAELRMCMYAFQGDYIDYGRI